MGIVCNLYLYDKIGLWLCVIGFWLSFNYVEISDKDVFSFESVKEVMLLFCNV